MLSKGQLAKTAGMALLAASAISPSRAQTLNTLYAFGAQPDGVKPDGALIKKGNILYGTTQGGGTAGYGAIVSVDASTGQETVLYGFAGGTTDGQYPYAGLVRIGDTVYGSTEYGGSANKGVIFAFNLKTKTESVLHAFTGSPDGWLPICQLVNVGGVLYGTTRLGGASNNGTIFSIDPGTGIENVLYSFAGSTGGDGAQPYAGLSYADGVFYGTTIAGGTGPRGTVFQFDPSAGAETVLYNFTGGADGATPYATVTPYKGKLYGVTYAGGANGDGTVYEVDPSSKTESVLFSFTGGVDGRGPTAAPTVLDKALYGTTLNGGTDGYGTIWSVSLKTGAETTLWDFTGGADGAAPYAGLIARKGVLYGDTQTGANGSGTIFSLTP